MSYHESYKVANFIYEGKKCPNILDLFILKYVLKRPELKTG